ncbi:MAG: hypothetical protein R3B06_19755 [Kofleriaceae bacterium]
MGYAHDLAPDERRELLRIARATLREFIDSGRIPPGKPHRASLVAPAAVEVRLLDDGAEVAAATAADATRPLYRAIQEAVVAAARAAGPLDEARGEHLTIAIAVAGEPPQAFAEPARAT